MTDQNDKADAQALAGGAIAVAMLQALVTKGVFTNDDAVKILDAAGAGLGFNRQTVQGREATKIISGMGMILFGTR